PATKDESRPLGGSRDDRRRWWGGEAGEAGWAGEARDDFGAARTGVRDTQRIAFRRAHASTAASIAASAPSMRRSLRSRSVGSNVRQLRLTSSANSLDDIIAPDSSRTRSLLRRGAEPCTATSR